MIIDCVSDLHGTYPETEGGDVLIVAGDCTASNKSFQWAEFYTWFKAQKYRKKILVAGNHDGFLNEFRPSEDEEGRLVYLCDSGCEFEGVKFWGSPWTPKFGRWHFMRDRKGLDEAWNLVPQDTNVLITHGPPYGILDKVIDREEHVGDIGLRNMILNRDWLPELKLHVFGHIHEQGGKEYETNFVKFVNCSLMDERYEPVNKVMRVIL